MSISRRSIGVWLIATPLLFCSEKQPELLRFTLEETPAEVSTLLGAPALMGEAGPGHFSWYFQIDVADQHDHSHILLFRKSDRKLVSLTRNYHEPQNVDLLFPVDSSRTYYWEGDSAARWPVRVRILAGDRVLIAMGVAKPGELTTQVMLIRRGAVAQYLPWLAARLRN